MNKTAVISGASSGLGYELSKLLCQKYGCRVIGLARRKEKLDAIREELGEGEEEEDEEIIEYNEKIARAALPDEVREKLVKEVKKLAKTP